MDRHPQDEIVERILGLLSDCRPRPFDDIAAALELTDDQVEAALEADRLAWTPDGYVDVFQALEGRYLTHRLSAREAEGQFLELDADLEGLLPFIGQVPLADGSEGRIGPPRPPHPLAQVEPDLECLWGPEGWLGNATEGSLVGLSLVDGRISVGVILSDPEAGDREVTALADAAAECVGDEEEPITSLLATAILADPALFIEPVVPLGELLARAGLGAAEGFVWHEDGLDEEPYDRREFLEDAYGFADCCHQAFEEVQGALGPAGGQPRLDAEVARALSHGGVGPAITAELLIVQGSPARRDPAEVEGLARDLARVAVGAGAAGPHYLRAMALEALDRVLDAEAALGEAILADPGHGPALDEAAKYAEDRGDSRLALSLARRSGAEEGDPEMVRLARLTRPAARRNDPCPCGSGRKYKVCCLRAGGQPLPMRVEWLYDKAFSYCHRPRERRRLLELAQRLAWDEPDDPGTLLLALADPLVVDILLFEDAGLVRFLASRGPLLPADEHELAQRWAEVPRGLFEIVSWTPATRRLELRDTRGGDTIAVAAPPDPADGSGPVAGELLLGRPLPDGRGLTLVGPILNIPLRLREAALAIVSGPAGAEEWIDFLRFAQQSPVLVNAEREPIVLCTARYPVVDREPVLAELTRALEAGESEDGDEAVFHQHVEIDGESWLRGTVRVAGDELTVEANSEPRFERLLTTVDGALGGTEPIEERRVSAQEAMAERLAAEEAGAGLEEAPAPEATDPELLELVQRQLSDYAVRWVDQSITALGGQTPRQARDDPTLREDLEILLRAMERIERDPLSASPVGMPIEVVRRALGLPIG